MRGTDLESSSNLAPVGESSGWDFPKLDACNDLEGFVAHLLEILVELVLNVVDASGRGDGNGWPIPPEN